MDYIVWWEEYHEGGLEQIHGEFLKSFKKTEFIPAIYNPILYKYYQDNNLKHWDKKIMKIGSEKLINFQESLDDTLIKNTLLNNLNLLIDSYESMRNIVQKVELMDNFKGSMQLKASVFLIDIYNDLLNGPYSKTLQLYIKFQSEIEGKKLDQKTLRQQMDCLSTREYDDILKIADANIRNSMAHGGVKVEQNDIYFTYRNGKDTITEKHSIYEVKHKTISLLDSINGLIISFIKYLIENHIIIDDVYSNPNVKDEVILFFEKLCMSTLKIECKSIEEIDVIKDDLIQVNVLLEHNNLDINSMYLFGVHTAARVYTLKGLCSKDKVLVTFEADKTLTSFIRFPGDKLGSFVAGKIDEVEVVESVRESQDYALYPANKETRNKYEDLFRYYPEIESEKFIIKEIEDISLPEKKRFRAVVYVKKILNRKHIETIALEAVKRLRQIRNYGFTNHEVKHGDMEADVLYLVIYKKEVRKPEKRTLIPSNKNFLVQIQYDKNKQFDIKNPLINRNTYKVIKGHIEYNWNPNFYKFG